MFGYCVGVLWIDPLVVSLLCADEGEAVGAEAELQQDVVLEVKQGQQAAVHVLGAPQLHEDAELLCKPENGSDEHGHINAHSHRSSGHF